MSEVNLTRGLLQRRWRGKRRPIEVARDILQACLVAPTPPTIVMYRAQVNPAVLKKYVGFLVGRGLLSEVGKTGWGGRRRYMATPSGRYLHRAILDLLAEEEEVAKAAEEVLAQLNSSHTGAKPNNPTTTVDDDTHQP